MSFAEALADKLGCTCVTREDILKRGRDYGLDQFKIDRLGLLDKEPPSIWDRWQAERNEFLTLYRAALMDFVVNEKMVYVGNIGRLILSDIPKLLRIRLDASREFRVKMRMDEQGIGRGEAKQFVLQVDRRRETWSRFLFGTDYFQHAIYDLILNLESLSLDSLVTAASQATTLPEFTIEEHDRKKLRCLHLEARVRAALTQSPRTKGMELDIQCDSTTGKVIVRGAEPMVAPEIWKKDIEGSLEGLEGVQSVEVRSKAAE
jgi:hypothetical protein